MATQRCRCEEFVQRRHIVCELPQETVDVLDAVGGAEGSLEHWYQSQAMQREGLFQAFLEAVEGRLVPQLQARFERFQRGLGFRVRRVCRRPPPSSDGFRSARSWAGTKPTFWRL